MRLIDADELKIPSEEVIEKMAIALAPTIDPVKHGRWLDATKEIGWPIWKCSVCGGDGRGDYFVCPWCGAKMDKGGDAK